MTKDLTVALRIKAEMNSAVAEIKEVRGELKGMGDAAGKAGDKAKGAGQKVDKLGDKAKGAGEDVDKLGDKAKGAGEDVDKLGDKAKGAGEDVDKLGDKAKGAGGGFGAAGKGARRFTAALRATGVAAAAFGAIRLAGSVVEAGIAMERLDLRFRAAAGSAQAGAEEMTFVRAEAERLGIELRGAAEAYSGFAAAARGTALEGQAAREVFTAVAEAGRAMGLSADQQRGALLALEQMVSKGVVSAEELRGQLGERLPGAFQLAARAMGVTTEQLGKMLQKGEILAEDLLPKLARELRASVAEALPGAVEGADAAINRLGNAFEELGEKIAESGILGVGTTLVKVATEVVQALTPREDDFAGKVSAALKPPGGLRQVSHESAASGKLPAILEKGILEGAVLPGEVLRHLKDFNTGLVEKMRIDPRLIEAASGDTRAVLEVLDARRQAIAAAAAAEEKKANAGSHGGRNAAQRATVLKGEIEAIDRRMREVHAEIAVVADAATVDTTFERYDAAAANRPSKAAAKATAQMRRQIALYGDLTHEGRVLWETQEGRWKAESEATKERLLEGARRLDMLAELKHEDEETARREQQAADARKAAIEDIEAQALALLPAYERERAEIERQLEAQLAALKEEGKGYEDTERRRAEAREVAAERIRRLDEEEAERRRQAAEEEEQRRRDVIEAAEDEAERRLRASRHWRDGAIRGLRDYAEAATDAGKRADDGVTSGIKSMEGALVEFVTTGKLSVSDFADHIIAEMARAAIQQSITGPLASGLSGLLTTGLGSLVGGYGVFSPYNTAGPDGVVGSVFHTGGVAGEPGGTRRVVAPAVFAGARRYHRGGIAGMLRPEEIPAILERGEEVIPARDPRHRANLAAASAAAPTVIVNIDNRDGPPQREVNRSVRWDGKRAVVDIVTENIADGGNIAKAIDGRRRGGY